MRAQNKKYKSDIASHQEQLQALKDQDPEFYEYLQQTDQELLNFGQDDDEEGEQQEMQEAAEDEQAGPKLQLCMSTDLLPWRLHAMPHPSLIAGAACFEILGLTEY